MKKNMWGGATKKICGGVRRKRYAGGGSAKKIKYVGGELAKKIKYVGGGVGEKIKKCEGGSEKFYNPPPSGIALSSTNFLGTTVPQERSQESITQNVSPLI